MSEEAALKGRLERFQSLMVEHDIDASMIRTLSSFTYFAGIKWLRPALLIPAEGDPTAFIMKYEAQEFAEKTWIRDIETWRSAEELMRAVSGTIRRRGYRVMGFDYSVERDSYVLFFELFKKLNPQVRMRDVHGLIMKLRMVKDRREIESIRRASAIAVRGMSAAVDAVDVGVSELEIAAEAVYSMMRHGAERPHVYVTTGPRPRVHAEPRAGVKVASGHVVNVVVGADHGAYHSNMSRTLFVGPVTNERRRAFEAAMEAYHLVEGSLKPGARLIDIDNGIREILEERGYGEYYVVGFAHGVGLLMEEDPITTIVVPHRRYEVVESMTLAAVHAPLTIPGVGSVKLEDTFVMGTDGAKRLTEYPLEVG